MLPLQAEPLKLKYGLIYYVEGNSIVIGLLVVTFSSFQYLVFHNIWQFGIYYNFFKYLQQNNLQIDFLLDSWNLLVEWLL